MRSMDQAAGVIARFQQPAYSWSPVMMGSPME
jgi:hypothetical protein